MRPKKVILLCLNDDNRNSVMTFMLRTNGWAVLPAPTPAVAVALFAERPVDLVLCDLFLPVVSGIELIAQLKLKAGFIPMALYGNVKKMGDVFHLADAVLDTNCPTEDLLNKLKGLVARKRGPRKGSTHAVLAEACT